LKVSNKKEKDIKEKTLSAPMINYFSIGQESKVGVAFDKNRTSSQTCNLCVYACQGLGTELDCLSQQHIGDIVSGMHLGTGPEAPVLFAYCEEHSFPELVGNPESLMFLNVDSYAGGAARFWQRATRCGVKPEPARKDINVSDSPGDGRIEVLTLPNIAHIALDKVVHQGQRIHSGGPYYCEFFGPNDGQECMDVYCEVDGEFYHLVNPLSASITHQKKLQVLQNDEPMEDPLASVAKAVSVVAKSIRLPGT